MGRTIGAMIEADSAAGDLGPEAISTEAKVAALREPAAYPSPPERVETIETHMSWVFLAGGFVYKLKKSVREDHLDLGSLEARHFYCLEELRLNRRLAPSVYLDVVPLSVQPDGVLRIGPPGAVVDWLVLMRRLPAHSMLDRLVENGTASSAHMRTVATLLADFYRSLAPAVTYAARYLALLRAHIDEFEEQLCDPELHQPLDEVHSLCRRLHAFMQRRPGLFEERVREGRIVEGHGDLRPEHVSLGEPPAIIDCLEFSPGLRTLDTADELGFLALECERLGVPALGRDLFDAYGRITGDLPDASLVHFHQAFRACIRARIAARHLKEARYRHSKHWTQRARQYLDLASRHLDAAEASLPSPGTNLPAAA